MTSKPIDLRTRYPIQPDFMLPIEDWLKKDALGIMVTENEIHQRVADLGSEITQKYKKEKIDEILAVGVLNGAMTFLTDLVSEIGMSVNYDTVRIESYGSGTEPGKLKLVKDMDNPDIRGKDILIIEDIIDMGYTLDYLRRLFESRYPKSISICVLLDKPDRRKVDVPVEYTGFLIPDNFVVGYGLDFNGKYRNSRNIVVLKPELYAKQ